MSLSRPDTKGSPRKSYVFWALLRVRPAPKAHFKPVKRPGRACYSGRVLARDKRLTAVVLSLALLAASCSSAGTADRGFDDAVEELEQMGTLRYLIATPSNGECNVLASRDDESLLPLASVFKLYVLGALVQAVDGGEITWDDPVQIRDEFDSLGGTTAEEKPGTELSVRELATRMISDSDNTATDHLMDLVGREAVEQIQSTMGHSQPSANVPMPTTRDVTILKFSGDDDLADRYVAADAEERRSILDVSPG